MRGLWQRENRHEWVRPGHRVWVAFPSGVASFATRVAQVNECNLWVLNGTSPPLAVLPEWCASRELVRG